MKRMAIFIKKTQKIRYFALGVIVTLLLSVTVVPALAASTNRQLNAMFNNIKIVVDGTLITPKDSNGKAIEPFIVDGTTYLPVRAVADAVGKEVYWDGPNYTVYLGAMGDIGQSMSLKLENAVNIGDYSWLRADSNKLTDNYGNTYSTAFYTYASSGTFETLLNMKYSAFKGTAYVVQGYSNDGPSSFTIEADGHTIYTSPQISKTSSPIQINVNIAGYNDFKIIYQGGFNMVFFGNCGFYQ